MSLNKMIMSGIKKVAEEQIGKRFGSGGSGGSSAPQNQGGYNQEGYQGGNQGYNQGGGYSTSGYPDQGGAYSGGYGQQGPGQQGSYGGYPPPPQGGSYPEAKPEMSYGGGYGSGGPGYPPGGPGYPPQPSGAPGIGFNVGGPAGGAPYPPSGPGYPSGGPGYPPQGGVYGGQQPGYPPQGGQPAYGSGYGQPQQGGYGSGYPPQQNFGAPQQYGAPPQQNYGGGAAQNTMQGTPSVRPYPAFNANADAETLRKAMKGFGCNNTKVIQVLCARTNWQRQEIARQFKTMYGKDLIHDLKSELTGDFEDLILALMEPPARYDAQQLYKAMEGLGTKEHRLIEIMCTRSNQQINEIKWAYKQMYNRDLERDLVGETSGFFKRLLVSLCAGGRDESGFTDPVRANQDARRLYQAGEGRLGTDEAQFNAILVSQNAAQLRLVFQEYEKVTKHPIETAIDREFSGDIRDGLQAIVATVRNRPGYFSKLLNDSMKGFGTRDTDLIRIVVTRAEVDMADIRNAYQAIYKQPLEKAIQGDCSGSYKDGLIALVRGN